MPIGTDIEVVMDNVQILETTEKGTGLLTQDVVMRCMAGGAGLLMVVRPSDLKVLYANDKFEKYLGYSNEDLQGRGIFFTDLVGDYLTDRLRFHLNTVTSDPGAGNRYVLYPLISKNGEGTNPYYLYVSLIHSGDEPDMYSFVLHPDFSKWDMPFTSFNTRELFLEQFNGEDFGTFEWIMGVDKVFWSAGVYRIYEIEDKQLVINRKVASHFIHPQDRAATEDATANAVVNGTDVNLEYRIITAKKKIKIIHSLARVIKDHEGKAVKLIGSIRDVTVQRNIEQNLKDKVEELNHSNKELEEFAFVASHDMQEPLRKITTFSDRLFEKYKDVLAGDGLMYLSRMVASAENMRLLINNLLDFSKISKNKQPFEPVNLNLILKQVKTDLELIIEETGTVINSSSLPMVEAIPSQMKQLFANICSNAIKFRKPDVSPLITIETTRLSDIEKNHFELQLHEAYYKISITDNGIGFEDEYSTRIFQVFQRLHGKSEYPGSGIGLAICKKILEYHHGVIFAENIPNTGARFVFILPEQQEALKQVSE